MRVIWFQVFFIAWSVWAKTNEITAIRIEVSEKPLDVPIASSANWLVGGISSAIVPGVELRSQGAGAPQSDLIIRGNPFNAGGMMLEGLTLRNPQTEHFHADFSVPYDYFAEPRLLTGVERFVTGSGHPAGSVALVFAPLSNINRIAAGVGEYGQQYGRLMLSYLSETTNGVVSGVSGFGSWERMDRTDGQPDNELERWSGGGRGQYLSSKGEFNILAAYSRRSFGTRGFYGASTNYPAEEELEEGIVAATLLYDVDPDTFWRAALAWQWSEDKYWLNRTNHNLYANTHLSQVLSGQIAGQTPLSSSVTLNARIDGDWEWIRSSYEGTISSVGLGNHDRGHVSFALLPEWSRGQWKLIAGGSLDLFTHEKPAWLPAVEIKWKPSESHQFYASYSESERRPSYTELNYESPDSLGNSGLKRQEMRTWELGWRGRWQRFEGNLTLFFEDGRDIVDWIWPTDADTRWMAANLSRVRSKGLVADWRWKINAANSLAFKTLMVEKDCNETIYASRYALDYARQRVEVRYRLELNEYCGVSLWQGAAAYAKNPARYGSRHAFDAGIETRLRHPALKGLTLTIGAENIWDEDFEVFPGQNELGRRAYAALDYIW